MEKQSKKIEVTRKIPKEVLYTEIFPMLPWKCLCRFKCVSKDWKTTISSFEQQILMLGYTFPTGTFKAENVTSNIHGLSYDQDGIKSIVDMSCPRRHVGDIGANYSITGSCNGIVCLELTSTLAFGIWNPKTDQFQQVPYEMLQIDGMTLEVSGFGYREDTDDYYVFTMFANRANRDWSWLETKVDSFRFYLFSFTSGAWREITVPRAVEFADHLGIYRGVVFANSHLYWPRYSEERLVGLFFFDEEVEQIRSVNLSPEFEQLRYVKSFDIFELGGSLSIACSRGDQICHVWVHRQERADEPLRWVRLYRFNVVRSLSFTPWGQYLVPLDDQNQLKLVDVTKNQGFAEASTADHSGYIGHTLRHFPTLIRFDIRIP